MEKTPQSNRTHIAVFGRTNIGKSTLINAITGQETALVSTVPGTTTDPVIKSMELKDVGPVVFIDTAGFGDNTELGALRIEKTKQIISKCDIAVMLFSGEHIEEELRWFHMLKESAVHVIALMGKADLVSDLNNLQSKFQSLINQSVLPFSVNEPQSVQTVLGAITKAMRDKKEDTILKDMVKEGDLVLLVMPQDIQAPKGRLILPQTQILRELLDRQCIAICTTKEQFVLTLAYLKESPDLIITDSQLFDFVSAQRPINSKLTSFSVLFAEYKGDLDYFIESVKVLDNLPPDGNILISEACTHVPVEEDIGRVKIPNFLRKKYGSKLQFTFVRGKDWPEDLTPYHLIIHCGACMFTKTHVTNRVADAKKQNVPMTNYGIVIAYLKNVLNSLTFPGENSRA